MPERYPILERELVEPAHELTATLVRELLSAQQLQRLSANRLDDIFQRIPTRDEPVTVLLDIGLEIREVQNEEFVESGLLAGSGAQEQLFVRAFRQTGPTATADLIVYMGLNPDGSTADPKALEDFLRCAGGGRKP